ncbi:TPK-B1-binding domain-containing protein [Mycena indigotica]|uniref:TPK-B1-binding domain-containing protein n=1 Tax=Mycena indigotica TaxID=2126181 RepID=A0A8H6T7Q0_9AGAR|nr:TPK-B1-binding domain-containing protein [Mycena indigotica]KAF7312319.1 TPK-B1-binding domain-containing protein [Mycena indigotica]
MYNNDLSNPTTSSYSWHQSHDQATVLLLIPHSTTEADIHVEIESTGQFIIAGLHGQPPILKGRLYAPVDGNASLWQLEPLTRSRLSARERTNSTTSTASSNSGSSYAFVSDNELSSSFVASLETSDVEDGSTGETSPRRIQSHPVSRSVSPGRALQSLTTSSFSSLESLHSRHSRSGRLLTIHIEKKNSSIWPSLIVGPAPDSLSPSISNTVVFDASEELEHQYNMDPTSLTLIAQELLDIQKNKEEAFEYFLRAWHQSHSPTATIKLVTHYVPLKTTVSLPESEKPASRGTILYYAQCLGSDSGLAQLYLEAGLLHLEGLAASLLTSSASSLASLRVPIPVQSADISGTEAWKRDREAAATYFERARLLQPSLDIPVLPPANSRDPSEHLEMPSIDIQAAFYADPMHKRKPKESESSLFGNRDSKLSDEYDNTWYLYVPGLVGAGTALLVVGVITFSLMTTWTVDFLLPQTTTITTTRALIVLNQPFSKALFLRVWNSSQWRCCADGGANRLFDILGEERVFYLPQLIKGDLDSLRPDVRKFYASKGVPIVGDPDQDSTDLMKCISVIDEKEASENKKYDIVLLGGLSGRLDQTIHTLSYLFKLRKTRERVFAVTDENVGWVLDAGEHTLSVDHSILGPTCGLLPVGVDSTILSTSGLRWNLSQQESSFGGLVSTSNHLVPSEERVWIRTSRPIWWTAELRLLT